MPNRERHPTTKLEQLFVQLSATVAIGASVLCAAEVWGAAESKREISQLEAWKRDRAANALEHAEPVRDITVRLSDGRKIKAVQGPPAEVIAHAWEPDVSHLQKKVNGHQTKAQELGTAAGGGIGLGLFGSGLWVLRAVRIRRERQDAETAELEATVQALAAPTQPLETLQAATTTQELPAYGQMDIFDELMDTQPPTWRQRLRAWGHRKLARFEVRERNMMGANMGDIPRPHFAGYQPTSTLEHLPLDFIPPGAAA